MVNTYKYGLTKKALDRKDLDILERIAGLGLTYDDMAVVLGMSPNTFARIRKEYPAIDEIIEKGRVSTKVKISSRVVDRAMESDKVLMFAAERKAGWISPKDANGTGNVTINNNVSVSQTNNTANIGMTNETNYLDQLTDAELKHYQSLNPEDLLQILSLKNPSDSDSSIQQSRPRLPESIDLNQDAIEVEPKEQQESIPEPPAKTKKKAKAKPKQDIKFKPAPTPKPPKEGYSDLEKRFNELIDNHLVIYGHNPALGPRKQPFMLVDDLTSIFKKCDFHSSNDQGAFYSYLEKRGVVRKRSKDSITKANITLLVGCSLRK